MTEATSGNWADTDYDIRDRIAGDPSGRCIGPRPHTVTYNYAVGGDPLTTSVTNPAAP